MKRKVRVFLSLMVALAIVVACLPITALAGTGDTGTTDGFEWEELEDGTIAITGYTGGASVLVFPSQVGGKDVTSIGIFNREAAFEGNTTLTSVTIPDGVIRICAAAFMNCKNIETVSIPDSVRYIDNRAFANCESMEEIALPSSLQSLGQRAFIGCTSLTEVIIPDGCNYIGPEVFMGCTQLADVTIPDTVESIGYSSFDGTPWVTGYIAGYSGDYVMAGDSVLIRYKGNAANLTLPGTVKHVGGNALHSNVNIKTIVIPDSVTSLDEKAFADCANLDSATIPASVTNIGDNAFVGCRMAIGIFGFDGSAAESYASGNSIPFHLITQNAVKTNPSTGVTVSGTLPDSAELTVQPVAATSELYEKAQENVGSGQVLLLFDISLMLGEERIQPSGDITITMPIPEEYRNNSNLTVGYVDDSGNITYLDCTVSDGKISFTINHLSGYALILKATSTPGTGDGFDTLLLTVIAFGALVTLSVFAKRKALTKTK